jgi:hypothetical protein
MLRETLRQLSSPTLNTSNRTFYDLSLGMRTLALVFRFSASVTIAGGPITAIRNAGSLLSQFLELGLNENGDDVVRHDPRLAGFISQANSARVVSSTRLISTANGTYALEETVLVPLGNPRAVNIGETSFVAKDPRAALSAFVTWVPSVAALCNAGAATVTITTPTITVEQLFDDETAENPPILRPYFTDMVIPITATTTALPFYLKTSRFVRSITIQQDTNVGEVADIITALTLRGDRRTYYGPNPITYADLQRRQEFELAGDVFRSGYLHLDFQRGGRLSNIINPNTDTNFRLELNATPSVAAGATSSLVRVSVAGLEVVPGVTAGAVGFEA